MSTQLAALGIEVIEGYERGPAEAGPGRVRGRQRDEPRQSAGRGDARQRHVATSPGPNGWPATCLRDAGCSASPARTARRRPPACSRGSSSTPGSSPDSWSAACRSISTSARASAAAAHFVVEADEYDTAFFDKRAKFVHYRPRTAILNNLEHDHADIYPDVASIQRQFHLLLRTVPGNGRIVDERRGPQSRPGARDGLLDAGRALHHRARRPPRTGGSTPIAASGWCASSPFTTRGARTSGDVEWGTARPPQRGERARRAGGGAPRGCRRAGGDRGAAPIRRRAATARSARHRARRGRLRRLRASPDRDRDARSKACAQKAGEGRVIAVLEPRSNTMKLGTHKAALAAVTARRRPRVRLPVARGEMGRRGRHARRSAAWRRCTGDRAAGRRAGRGSARRATTWC